MSNAESARNGNSPPSAVPIRSSLFTIPWYRATKIENISRFVETLLPDISKSKLYRFIIFSIYIPQDWTSKSIIRVSMYTVENILFQLSNQRFEIAQQSLRVALLLSHQPYNCTHRAKSPPSNRSPVRMFETFSGIRADSARREASANRVPVFSCTPTTLPALLSILRP